VPVLVPGFEEKRGFFYQKITFFQITGGLFYINLPFLTLDQKSPGSSPGGATSMSQLIMLAFFLLQIIFV
jgi:hypothetical protein